MAKPTKHVGDIDMKFTTEDTTPKPITTPAETFEKDGHVIYKKDESGFMQFYDGDNNPIGDDVVEKLADAYKPAPLTNDTGQEQEGETKTRYIKYEKQEPKEATDPITKNVEVDFKDCDIIEERTYYKNGEALIQTIPKKHYYVVKYLRGEYDEDEKNLKAESKGEDSAKKEEVIKEEEK